MYNIDKIRELLIDSIHSRNDAKAFFSKELMNNEILESLLSIVIEDDSNDARMEASYWISKFEVDLLKKHEGILLQIQKDELDSVACHSFMALAKIKSKMGMMYIIEKRLKSEYYWESEALKLYLNEN